MKKPFLKLKTRSDKLCIALLLLLCLSALALLAMPDEALGVMSSGDGNKVNSLIGLVGSWV